MRSKAVILAGLGLWAAACQGIDVGVETQAVANPTEAPASSTAPPAVTETVAPTPTAPGAPTATTQPENHPLAGLVYTIGAGNGLWRIGADGTAELLTDQHQPALAPDQQSVLYAVAYEGDIWIRQLPDGLGTNLTNTPEQDENDFWWWPANPGVVVFSSRTEAGGPFATTLGLMDADGGNYRLLEDTTPSGSPPALSPDGRSLAFDKALEPWVYHLDGGAEPLPLSEFGLEFDKAAYPIWSPDGSELAWKVYGGGQSGVAVMNLAERSARLLHLYTLQGGSEIWAEMAWSPDGEWIAVVNQAERPGERSSLWVLRADGSEEHYLGGRTSAPVWSPDSRWLVYSQLPDEAGAFDTGQVKRVETGAWTPETLELPGGAEAEQWVTLRP